MPAHYLIWWKYVSRTIIKLRSIPGGWQPLKKNWNKKKLAFCFTTTVGPFLFDKWHVFQANWISFDEFLSLLDSWEKSLNRDCSPIWHGKHFNQNDLSQKTQYDFFSKELLVPKVSGIQKIYKYRVKIAKLPLLFTIQKSGHPKFANSLNVRNPNMLMSFSNGTTPPYGSTNPKLLNFLALGSIIWRPFKNRTTVSVQNPNLSGIRMLRSHLVHEQSGFWPF